ncbi:MAG: cbb3-type cytochrome c oxidase N-terminal domain-containing protein [Saprospiraceae bacterium]
MKNTQKILFILSILIVLPVLVHAGQYDGVNSMQFTLIALGVAVILGAIGTVFWMASIVIQSEKIKLLKEQGIEVARELNLEPKPSLWEQLNKRAWSLVPLEKEKDIMLDHDYDGIKELDNVLPPWWVGMFYASIVFAIGYFGYYHVMDTNWSSAHEWETEMAEAEEAVKAYLAKQSNAVDENSVIVMTDPTELSRGQSIYDFNCAVCHGKLGEGGVGPNLADSYWLHGGDVKAVFKTIKYGVPEKGMIAWKAQLTPSNMAQVASYILTMQGTNPPNAKEPQGDLYQPDSEEPKDTESEPANDNEKIGMN